MISQKSAFLYGNYSLKGVKMGDFLWGFLEFGRDGWKMKFGLGWIRSGRSKICGFEEVFGGWFGKIMIFGGFEDVFGSFLCMIFEVFF
jgi:hypothetical protein